MTNSISDKICTLVSKKAEEADICAFADEWLAICGDLFADDAGYVIDGSGSMVFVPASLCCEISTQDLASLLSVADEFDRFEDTVGIYNQNDYLNSILSHIKIRANEGDIFAKGLLLGRAGRKTMESETVQAII